MVYNIRHGVDTEIRSSETVRNILHGIKKEIGIERLVDELPTLLLEGNKSRCQPNLTKHNLS